MNKKNTYKMVALLLVIIILIVTICITFLDNFGKTYCDDVVVISPDGNHQLLIHEWGTVGGTGAEIYAINPHLPKFLNRLIKVKVGNTSSADCCYSFSQGNYDVIWEDDCVVIYYFSGRESQALSDKSTWSFVRCNLR